MFITLEISLTNADSMCEALDKIVLPDPKSDKEKAGQAYLTEVFFPTLNEVVEDFNDGS